jgi:hypothetical protein
MADRSFLTDSGYIDTSEFPADITLEQLGQAIDEEISTLKILIRQKNSELSGLIMRLSAFEHSKRTAWLLFKNK